MSLLNKLRASKDEGGFTLIELLVVVLIIGVLAAIAVPVFFGQVDNARNQEINSAAQNAYTQAVADSVDGDLTAAEITAIEERYERVEGAVTVISVTVAEAERGDVDVTVAGADGTAFEGKTATRGTIGDKNAEDAPVTP